MPGIYPVPLPSPIKHIFVAFDSLSALAAISDIHFTHPLVSRIHTLLSTLISTSYTVTFVWVPSHRGIPSNEKVAAAAKAATSVLGSILKYFQQKPIFLSSFAVILQIIGSLSGKTKHLLTNCYHYQQVAFWPHSMPNDDCTKTVFNITAYIFNNVL